MNRPLMIPVKVDDEIYGSLGEAEREHNMPKGTLKVYRKRGSKFYKGKKLEFLK